MGWIKTHARKHNQGGFTIVEVMVVIVVFGIGLAALSSLFSSIQYSQRNILYMDIATQAARAEIERVRNAEFATITNGASFTSKLPSTLPTGSTGTVAVSTPTNVPTAKQLDVTVTYPIGSITKQVTISAIIDSPS
jgi:prepilin-type N-terminal cleavage/methylation domain-containing protein